LDFILFRYLLVSDAKLRLGIWALINFFNLLGLCHIYFFLLFKNQRDALTLGKLVRKILIIVVWDLLSLTSHRGSWRVLFFIFLRNIRWIREEFVSISHDASFIKLVLHHFIVDGFEVDDKVL
jgi:hypothetical protein